MVTVDELNFKIFQYLHQRIITDHRFRMNVIPSNCIVTKIQVPNARNRSYILVIFRYKSISSSD